MTQTMNFRKALLLVPPFLLLQAVISVRSELVAVPVMVTAPGRGRFSVRARSGYTAAEGRAKP